MPERPNILVFLTDDHGQWAAGCYGNQEIHTPTLNHLAATGVRMQNAITPSPVCSPARASFFTGLFPSQHGVHDWIHWDFEESPWLSADTPILPSLLQAAGYETALCGKWHADQSIQPQPGFDYWSGVDRTYPARNGTYVTTNGDHVARTGFNTTIITDDAIQFLRQRDTDKPFFLFVGYFGTHSPWRDHPERLVSQYRDCKFDDVPDDPIYTGGRLTGESLNTARLQHRDALAQYYAAVSHIDEGVGRVLDELGAQNLLDETLVVYAGDHGLNCGHHGIWGKGNCTRPLNMLEESIRIPMIFNCPGKRKSENRTVEPMRPRQYDGQVFGTQVRTEFTDHTDLFATLLDYAEVAAPDESIHVYPGRSLRPMLQDARGIPDWKDVQTAEFGPVRMIRSERYKLVLREPTGHNELYDLTNDPRERHNIYDETSSIVVDLRAQLEAFFAAHTHPERDGRLAGEQRQHNYVEAWRGEAT